MDEATSTGSKALGDDDAGRAEAGHDETVEAASGASTGSDTPDTRTPEEIQRDIERTRLELGDTAEALAAKADVKGQAKAKVDEVKQTARLRADETLGKLKDSSPESASAGADSVKTAAQENPVPFIAGGAFVFGILVGLVLRRG